jgi:hypothetical protein
VSVISNLALDSGDFARGNYYFGSLHIIDTVSSAVLGVLTPWGGNASDAMNIAGAFATAYVYGYFWGA